MFYWIGLQIIIIFIVSHLFKIFLLMVTWKKMCFATGWVFSLVLYYIVSYLKDELVITLRTSARLKGRDVTSNGDGIIRLRSVDSAFIGRHFEHWYYCYCNLSNFSPSFIIQHRRRYSLFILHQYIIKSYILGVKY